MFSRVRLLISAFVSSVCFIPNRLLGRDLAAALIYARLSSLIFFPFIGGTKVARRLIHANFNFSLFVNLGSSMAEKSKIEWCDATINPWMGCT